MDTEYRVAGMTCDHCVRSVTAAVGGIAGVRGVTIDLSTGSVLVLSDEPLTRESVAAAVTEAGYQLTA